MTVIKYNILYRTVLMLRSTTTTNHLNKIHNKTFTAGKYCISPEMVSRTFYKLSLLVTEAMSALCTVIEILK